MSPKDSVKINKNPANEFKIPKSILNTAKVLQFLSYNLATIFSVKLFKTPIKHRTPEREKMMAKSAQKEMVYIPSIDKTIMSYTYGFSRRKVLLIYGWSGRGTQLYKIADSLLENGFMTISFDAPAHGLSTGKTTMMTEFIECIKVLNEKHGNFEIGIGHSLGGMALLNSIKEGVEFKKAITIGAGDVISDIIKSFVQKLELKSIIEEKIKLHFYNKFNKNIDDYSASVAATSVNIQTLVIHDSSDSEVPVSCAYALRQKLDKGQLLITNSLGHNRILKDNFVIKQIIEFI
jgi:pimeloyl-ACP methyl ester carboxylesterase